MSNANDERWVFLQSEGKIKEGLFFIKQRIASRNIGEEKRARLGTSTLKSYMSDYVSR